MWGQFWSSHQRYFKYLCISAKVPHCVKIAREAVKNGKVSIRNVPMMSKQGLNFHSFGKNEDKFMLSKFLHLLRHSSQSKSIVTEIDNH